MAMDKNLLLMDSKNPLFSSLIHPLIDMICGAIAGAAGNFTGHPFDTVKLRKQISQTPESTL